MKRQEENGLDFTASKLLTPSSPANRNLPQDLVPIHAFLEPGLFLPYLDRDKLYEMGPGGYRPDGRWLVQTNGEGFCYVSSAWLCLDRMDTDWSFSFVTPLARLPRPHSQIDVPKGTTYIETATGEEVIVLPSGRMLIPPSANPLWVLLMKTLTEATGPSTSIYSIVHCREALPFMTPTARQFIANEVYNYARGGPVTQTIVPAKPALTLFVSAYHTEAHKAAFKGSCHYIEQNCIWDPRTARPLHGSIWNAKCSGPNPHGITEQHYPMLRNQHKNFNGINLVQIEEMWRGRTYGNKSDQSLGDEATRMNRWGSCLEVLRNFVRHVIQSGNFMAHDRGALGMNAQREATLMQAQLAAMQQAGLTAYVVGASLAPQSVNNGNLAPSHVKWQKLQERMKAAYEQDAMESEQRKLNGTGTMTGQALQPGQGADRVKAINNQMAQIEQKIRELGEVSFEMGR